MKFTRGSKEPLSEINVIPLVDIMLVLLIIFMITAPMLQHGMNIDLPKVTAKPLPSKEHPQVINIDRDSSIKLNDKKIQVSDLKAHLEFLFANKADKEIFLKASKDVPYGTVVRCMGIIRESGIDKINIVTLPAEER